VTAIFWNSLRLLLVTQRMNLTPMLMLRYQVNAR